MDTAWPLLRLREVEESFGDTWTSTLLRLLFTNIAGVCAPCLIALGLGATPSAKLDETQPMSNRGTVPRVALRDVEMVENY